MLPPRHSVAERVISAIRVRQITTPRMRPRIPCGGAALVGVPSVGKRANSMKYAMIVAGAALLLPGVAAAQDAGTAYGFGPGDRTATLSGSGINSKDLDDGNFGLAGSIDWFVLDNLAVGIRQDVNWGHSDEADAIW